MSLGSDSSIVSPVIQQFIQQPSPPIHPPTLHRTCIAPDTPMLANESNSIALANGCPSPPPPFPTPFTMHSSTPSLVRDTLMRWWQRRAWQREPSGFPGQLQNGTHNRISSSLVPTISAPPVRWL